MPGNIRSQEDGLQPWMPTTANRTKSLDNLAHKTDTSKGHDYVPARITRTQPKVMPNAMQFVKSGPAVLYKQATEQIKKAEAVKAMRKNLIAEEEDWQEQPSSSSSKSPFDEDTDWQSNLNKWKSSRRKRNEDALERVIEIKKNEQEEEFNKTRRKSKTFNEMQSEKGKRGRRYNLVVHDDDNNDLADLGLSTGKNDNTTLYDAPEDNEDNKDAKSDAGFCTGSDTGSDGVFAEDNISDTSSALGDKKETHDSLLDPGVAKEEEPCINGHGSSHTAEIMTSSSMVEEYTYDKAIEDYKQYAENSAKKRTSSVTSLNSNASFTKEEERKEERSRVNGRSVSPHKSNKMEEQLHFFSKEMEKDFQKTPEPKVVMREKSPKVDVGKRRSMFEMGDSTTAQNERDQKHASRISLDMSGSLRNKVASFENLEVDTPKVRGTTPVIETNLKSKVKSFENLEVDTPRVRGTTPVIVTNLKSKVKSFENLDMETTKVAGVTPTRDAKFHEKLATFASADVDSQPVKKKTPERDMNFHKKLASFTSIENGEEEKVVERRTVPIRDPSLKNKIASFQQLEQAEIQNTSVESVRNRDRSVSLENLDEPQPVKEVNAQVFEIASKLEETPLLGSPTLKAPTGPLPEPPALDDDSFEGGKLYNDDDINEVISDYDLVGGSYEEIPEHVENIYENITEEPLYENIYEKVGDQQPLERQDSEPHYQTLEEVRDGITSMEQVLPPAPAPMQQIPAAPISMVPEVLDVTWTDGPSCAAPPSEPPPPPPPDDDSDDDASAQPQSLPDQAEDGTQDSNFNRENSTRRIKKELWRRRSDFLGTSSQYIEEEPAVKPPPDLSDLLRQEREAERTMAEQQRNKTPTYEMLKEAEIARREQEIIESLERSEQMKQQQQVTQYTWHEESKRTEEQEMTEHLEYQVAKAESTSSESDRDDASVAPATSANTLMSSQSVLKTNESEHIEMSSQHLKSTSETPSTLLKDHVNKEDTEAVLHRVEYVELSNTGEDTQVSLPTPQTIQVETDIELQPELSEAYADSIDAHDSIPDNCSDSVASSGSQPDAYKKLAELEEEMMRHDQDMLQRAGKISTSSGKSDPSPPATMYAGSEAVAPQAPYGTEDSSYNYQPQTPQLPIQEFYTAPTYEPTPPSSLAPVEASGTKPVVVATTPSQYSTLASPHPFSRSQSQSSMGSPAHPPLQGVRSSPSNCPADPSPEPLPRKKKLPPPPPSKPLASSIDTAERSEAIILSRAPASDYHNASQQSDVPVENVSPSGQQMSKQTLLALSAIPKPRLTDNESWITKKKPESQRRDLSKHWLYQEAEQRRVEQHDRLNWQKRSTQQSSNTIPPHQTSPQLPPHQTSPQLPPHQTSPQLPPHQTSPQLPPHQTSPHPAHPQTTNYIPTQTQSSYPPQNTSNTYSSYPQALKNPSPIHSNNNNNNNNNSSWRNQATTYQPHIPAQAPPNADKALPDSIIHNLTQRVNSKNSKNTLSNSNGRLNNYSNNNYRDDNYHDYMNADALSPPGGHTPLYQSGIGSSQSSPPASQLEQQQSQDQRLLSVSGKKKCSHCSDELGRGAAMIIESLRLFYHIPCFKCCVCGIQLGNGSSGADVRVRNHKLHCHNCYSNDEGMKFSKV